MSRGRARAWVAAHPEARWLTGVMLLGFALRLTWAIIAVRQPIGLHDPFTYEFYGDQISRGHGYRQLDGQPTAYFPPGYPAALAATFWLVRHTPLPDDLPAAGAGLNIVLGLATIAIAYLLARRLFDVRVARVAAVIVAVYPNFVYHAAIMLSETLFTFLVIAALATLLWKPWPGGRPSRGRLAAFGVLIGLSALVRPVSLVLLPLVAVPMLAARVQWRRALLAVVVATATALAVILPWTARNAHVMGQPVFISLNGGDDLCIGHNPRASGHFDNSPYCDPPKRAALLSHREQELLRDRVHRHEAQQYALHHPVREVGLLFKRAYYLLYNDHDGLVAAESFGQDLWIDRTIVLPLLSLAGNLVFFLVLGAAVVGSRHFADRRRPRHLMLLLACLGLLAVPLATFGDPRFKFPAIPLLALIGAVPLAGLVTRARSALRQWRLRARRPVARRQDRPDVRSA
ncbi:MAG: ArnT family glycosyltransferase [Solirubrobacteraceae bacterium]